MTGSGQPPAAIDWGAGHYETTAAQLAPAAAVVVQRASLRPGERVLDLGCATGNAALLAVRAGSTVPGVDPAARLLEVARARAATEGAQIDFTPGDAASIPLAEASVDAIVSVFAVIFAPIQVMPQPRCAGYSPLRAHRAERLAAHRDRLRDELGGRRHRAACRRCPGAGKGLPVA